MILKTLMEEKQLDFNQPLLSVRRISSTTPSENDNKNKPAKPVPKKPPLPFYKSELKSGPVTNPGTVPFVWERTPGRPKNESKRSIERPSVAPKLPPGRVLKADQQDSDKVPKVTSVTQSRTGSTVSDSQRAVSLDNRVTKHESTKEVIEEKASAGSDDEDEAYLDALDTLSRTESFFMSCSVSGLSEWDDQEVQPSGSFVSDQQQARDFMIDRFLPAAKAMASETPQIHHHSRKPLVTQEQPKPVRKAVSGAMSRPLNQKWEKVLPHYAQDIDREESEDESDDDNGYENYAPKVCGLFPRFCLLNPVPGLRMENRTLSSTVHGVQSKSRRMVKEHGRTANYSKKSVNFQSGFKDQKDFLGTTEKSRHGIDPPRRACSKSLASESTQFESSCENPVVEKTLYVDSVHKVKSSSSCSSDTNLKGDDIDVLRKDTCLDKSISIDSSVDDRKHLCIVDEKVVLQPKSSASLDSSLLVCSDNLSDDIQMAVKNHSNSMCPEKQVQTKPYYQGSNFDHDLIAIPSSDMVECKKIESESNVSSSKKGPNALTQDPVSWGNRKFANDLKFDSKFQQATKVVDQECTLGSRDDPSTLACSKVAGDTKINLSLPHMKLHRGDTSNANSLKLTLALPSPKAPSESWLKRTLPTVSSRNILSGSNFAAHFHAPTQTPMTASPEPKWERIVKSSKVNNGHLQFTEGLLPSIPEG